MKKLLLPLLLICSLAVTAQKKHVYYDTVKTVQTMVDYSPDTIPVYFKELCIVHQNFGVRSVLGKPDSIVSKGDTAIYERWQKGFVVWQTYNKGGVTGTLSLSNGYSFSSTFTDPYYIIEYKPSPTMPGIYLYDDGKKTRVTNKVIQAFKR